MGPVYERRDGKLEARLADGRSLVADVIGFPGLAATAMEQGRVAMVHAFDLKYKTRVAPICPLAVYTIPEVYPTLGAAYKCAAYDGLGRLERREVRPPGARRDRLALPALLGA
jgi:hypothetical protein